VMRIEQLGSGFEGLWAIFFESPEYTPDVEVNSCTCSSKNEGRGCLEGFGRIMQVGYGLPLQ
jgi:hypothetical protein